MTAMLGACLLSILASSAAASSSEPTLPAGSDERAWTFLFYGGGDNDSEESFLPDMASLAASFSAADAIELLFFVDRSARYSASAQFFGEDFHDSRLYRFDGERAVRVAGGAAFPEITTDSAYEANSGDALTLRKALAFARQAAPARRTALVFYSHGCGGSWCPDEESGHDELWASEITDVLTEADSVDLLVFDVCSMAALENAYQWRPGNGSFAADVLVATPNAGRPFPWREVFSRIRAGTAPAGEPAWIAPAQLTARDVADLLIDGTRRHALQGLADHPEFEDFIGREAMTALDLSRAAPAKRAVDALARALGASESQAVVEALRGEGADARCMNYLVPEDGAWVATPFFDLYDLARRIAGAEALSDEVRRAATAVCAAADALVLNSFGLGHYDRFGGFQAGKNGVFLVFPDGDGTFRGDRMWRYLDWYLPAGVLPDADLSYAFCADGATPADGVVDNWFELLDAWFDVDNGEGGGLNGYRW